MNEQNRLRVQRIATRHASRTSEGWSEADSDAAFLAEFGRARDEVLTPLMEDVGAELKAAGYDFRVSPGGEAPRRTRSVSSRTRTPCEVGR